MRQNIRVWSPNYYGSAREPENRGNESVPWWIVIEGVLPSCPLPPDDRTVVYDSISLLSRSTRCRWIPYLLLEIGGEPVHVLVLRQDGMGMGIEEVVIQTPSIAMITGMLCSRESVLKCSSTSCAPARSSSNASIPIAQAMDRPMADHSE